MRARRFKNIPVALLLAIMLTGCGRSTPTNYYMLESALGPCNVAELPDKTLRVAQVEVAGYLNRNNIVSRVKGQTKLILAEFHLWAEPVGSGVRRVVEEVITRPLLEHGINVLPGSSESRSDYLLLLDVQRLDGNFNDMAILECKWTLLDRDDNPVERGIFSAEEKVAGADYNVLVNAESKLVRDLGSYLAGRIPQLLRKPRR